MKFVKYKCYIINVKDLRRVIYSNHYIVFEFYNDDDWRLNHESSQVLSMLLYEFECFLSKKEDFWFNVEERYDDLSHDYGDNP